MADLQFHDFEAFWNHFLASHRHPATRWMHVALVAVALRGAVKSMRTGSIKPLLFGAATASALATISHRFIEDDRPERTGKPLWSALALGRLVVRTLNGSIDQDLANLEAPDAA